MTRLPVGEPDQVRIQEPDGSLEALAAATDPAAVAEVAARHPTCLAAWAALGEFAGPPRATAASSAPSPASPRPPPTSPSTTKPTAAASSSTTSPPTSRHPTPSLGSVTWLVSRDRVSGRRP
jgi:hypothetical protein